MIKVNRADQDMSSSCTYQSLHEGTQLFGDDGELEKGRPNVRFVLRQGHTAQPLQRPDQTHFIVDMCYGDKQQQQKE